jgi:ubiquinone/menaquinone biosynthesis C-methylase UbiE
MTDAGHQQWLSGYDAELRRHNEVLRRACGVQFRDHVLDIGCGAGQTTRQAARTARAGTALGVDVSAPAIERARELARAEQLRNVAFERADAQVYRFPQEHFDLAISRLMVWQAGQLNEWEVARRSPRTRATMVSGSTPVPG